MVALFLENHHDFVMICNLALSKNKQAGLQFTKPAFSCLSQHQYESYTLFISVRSQSEVPETVDNKQYTDISSLHQYLATVLMKALHHTVKHMAT